MEASRDFRPFLKAKALHRFFDLLNAHTGKLVPPRQSRKMRLPAPKLPATDGNSHYKGLAIPMFLWDYANCETVCSLTVCGVSSAPRAVQDAFNLG
jgi:hypothetical protein